MMRRWGVVPLLYLAGCGGPPPGPPEEALALPSDTLAVEWAELPMAAPLSGGRWALVSPDWDAAVIADVSHKTITPLGGPRQQAYLHPFLIFSAGDSAYVADWGKRRTTVWSGEGKLVDSLPAEDALRGAFVRARDAAGQRYFQVDPAPRRDGSGNQDSIAIVRAAAGATRFDTIAYLAPRDLTQVTRENSTRFEQPIFSGNDLWGVWPDGTVWIARRAHNQVITRDTRGRVIKGPELPDPVYEVGPADRERFLQAYPPEVRPKETALAWASLFPPFMAAFTVPDGIWLEKSKPAIDSLRRIQVLDRGGVLRRVLVFRGDARLIGVGAERLLFAEQFEKGVRLLEVRIPLQR